MKKALSVFLSLIMLISVFSTAAYAENELKMDFSLSVGGKNNIKVKTGDIIDVVLTQKTTQDATLTLSADKILYDHEFFELVDGSNTIIAPDYMTSTPISSIGEHYVFFNTQKNFTYTANTSVEIGTFKLKVKATRGSSVVKNTSYSGNVGLDIVPSDAINLVVTIDDGTQQEETPYIDKKIEYEETKDTAPKPEDEVEELHENLLKEIEGLGIEVKVEVKINVANNTDNNLLTLGNAQKSILLTNMTADEAREIKSRRVRGFKIVIIISDADNLAVEEITAIKSIAGNNTIAKNYDITCNKEIIYTDGSTVSSPLTTLALPVKLSLAIQSELLSLPYNVEKREFSLIRTHKKEDQNFEAKLLEDLDQMDSTYTFSSDKFSTYSIAYEDELKANNGGNSGGGNVFRPKPTDEAPLKTQDMFGNTYDKHISYINGYLDGTVRADSYITREEVTAILYRLYSKKDDTKVPSGNVFTDVDALRWSTQNIEFMADIGVIKGYPDGTFKPEQNLTRAEFAALIKRFVGLTDNVSDISYKDLDKSHWAYNDIIILSKAGLLNGYEDGTIRPENNITRAEVIKVMNIVMGRKPSAQYLKTLKIDIFSDIDINAWYYSDVLEATVTHDYYLDSKSLLETKWENWK